MAYILLSGKHPFQERNLTTTFVRAAAVDYGFDADVWTSISEHAKAGKCSSRLAYSAKHRRDRISRENQAISVVISKPIDRFLRLVGFGSLCNIQTLLVSLVPLERWLTYFDLFSANNVLHRILFESSLRRTPTTE